MIQVLYSLQFVVTQLKGYTYHIVAHVIAVRDQLVGKGETNHYKFAQPELK